jgi:hypothetical protein
MSKALRERKFMIAGPLFSSRIHLREPTPAPPT